MGMQNKWLVALRQDALTLQEGRCAYCKEPITARTATADHKWPRSRRGGTERDNIVAACRPCNQTKGSMSHIEFYRLIDRRDKKAPMPRPEILIIWAGRQIWKRTKRACERIERRTRCT